MIKSEDILKALSRGVEAQEEKLSAQSLAKMLVNDEEISERPTNDLTKLASKAIADLQESKKVTIGDILENVFDNKEALTMSFSEEEKLASLRVTDPYEDLVAIMPNYCLKQKSETSISKLASLSGEVADRPILSRIDQAIIGLHSAFTVQDMIEKTASKNMFTEGFATEDTAPGGVGIFLMKRFGMI